MHTIKTLIRRFVIEALEPVSNTLTNQEIINQLSHEKYKRLRQFGYFDDVANDIINVIRHGSRNFNVIFMKRQLARFQQKDFDELVADIDKFFRVEKPEEKEADDEEVSVGDEKEAETLKKEKSRLEQALEKAPKILLTNSQVYNQVNTLVDKAASDEHGIKGIRYIKRYLEGAANGWPQLIFKLCDRRRGSKSTDYMGSSIATAFGIPYAYHDSVDDLATIIAQFVPADSSKEYQDMIKQSQTRGGIPSPPKRKGEFNFDAVPYYEIVPKVRVPKADKKGNVALDDDGKEIWFNVYDVTKLAGFWVWHDAAQRWVIKDLVSLIKKDVIKRGIETRDKYRKDKS